MEVDGTRSSENNKRCLDEESDEAVNPDLKKVTVKKTKKREITTVIVRNLPNNYNFYKVKKFFSQCGKVCRADVRSDANTASKLARVEFETHDEALSALTRTNKKIGQNNIKVEFLEDSTVWVTNFPPSFDKDGLKDLFEQFGGTVLSVRLPSLKFDANRRFAYIDMASAEQATKAIEMLNNTEIEGHVLVVKISSPFEVSKRTDAATLERREVFVRNLDFYKDYAQTLLDLFSDYGTIENITIPSSNEQEKYEGSKKLNSGIAFITFQHPDSAKKALALNKHDVEGRPLSVTLADRKAYIERQRVKDLLYGRARDNVVSLFPLSDKTTKAHILTFIKENAKINETVIDDIYLVTDHEGALIVLKDSKSAAIISLSLNGLTYDKKIIKCGGINDIKRHLPNRSLQGKKSNSSSSTIQKKDPKQSSHVEKTGKMTNEDFRHMLFGN